MTSTEKLHLSSLDLHEKPLFAGEQTGSRERTRPPINYRWLLGTVLVATFGAAILFTALRAADDGRFVAAKPSFVTRSRPGQREEGRSRKGDSLAPRDFSVSSVDYFRAALTEKQAHGEVSKVHNLVHVRLPLPTRIGDDMDIPELGAIIHNPTEEDAGVETADTAETALSVIRREIPDFVPGGEQPALTDDEVVKQVSEITRVSEGTMALPGAFTSQRILSRTLRMAASDTTDTGGLFGSLDVRIVPENLTSIGLTTDDRLRFVELDVVLEAGDSLPAILKANGASAAITTSIVGAFRLPASKLLTGQRIRLTIGPTPRGRQIQRVIAFDERGPIAGVAENDAGQFASIPMPVHEQNQSSTHASDSDNDVEKASPKVFKAAYASALKAGVPRKIMDEALSNLSEGIDLNAPAARGDSLELLFTDDERSQKPELLFAQISASGEQQSIYRFSWSESEGPQFLGSAGLSLDKLLLRKPLANGRISSPFGMRRHPILGYSRLHDGVDWAARQGTPLLAAGDGVVKWAEPRSGYGNRLELEHEQGYASAYNHMSAYARGIKPGTRVRRGQIVGYVGTTGLSTGPHVHFEITSNGHFVDPMKVRLPSRRQLVGAELARFEEQKSQLERLRAHAGPVKAAASYH